MAQRKFTHSQTNKVQEDVEFGKLQARCNAITYWNILFVIVGPVLFFSCLYYMMNELRSSDDMGRLFCIAGLIGSFGFLAFGIFNILKNTVDFYEYGIAHKKERLLYDNIEGIYAKKVISAGRSFVSIRMMYALKAIEGESFFLDSDDFRGLNDKMQDLANQLELPIGKY